MAEGKTNMFGKTYNTIGSTDSNFIIKTKGDLKVLWGNKYIDIIKNGKIASNAENMLFIVDDVNQITKNGLYLIPEEDSYQTWLNIDGVKVNITGSESSTTYISYMGLLQLEADLKHQALTNIGFYYETLNLAKNSDIKSGIIYVEDENKLYIVKNGILTEYIMISNSKGEEETENTRKHPLYIEEYSLWESGTEYIKCSGEVIYLYKQTILYSTLQSPDADEDTGYRLYIEDSKSVLEIDLIKQRVYPIPITYENLLLLIDTDRLCPKMYYLITDFQNPWEVTWADEPIFYEDQFVEIDGLQYQSGYRNAMQLVVLAANTNTLEKLAWYPDNPEWIIHYDPLYRGEKHVLASGAKLYGFRKRTNDEGVITYLPCKGIITYLKDELGNEGDFNFRHHRFKKQYYDDEITYRTYTIWRYCMDNLNMAIDYLELLGTFHLGKNNKFVLGKLLTYVLLFNVTIETTESGSLKTYSITPVDDNVLISSGVNLTVHCYSTIENNTFEKLGLRNHDIYSLSKFLNNTIAEIDTVKMIRSEVTNNIFKNLTEVSLELGTYTNNTVFATDDTYSCIYRSTTFKNNYIENGALEGLAGLYEYNKIIRSTVVITNVLSELTIPNVGYYINNNITDSTISILVRDNDDKLFTNNTIEKSVISITNYGEISNNTILNSHGSSIINTGESNGKILNNTFKKIKNLTNEGTIKDNVIDDIDTITNGGNNIINNVLGSLLKLINTGDFLDNIIIAAKEITNNGVIENNTIGESTGNITINDNSSLTNNTIDLLLQNLIVSSEIDNNKIGNIASSTEITATMHDNDIHSLVGCKILAALTSNIFKQTISGTTFGGITDSNIFNKKVSNCTFKDITGCVTHGLMSESIFNDAVSDCTFNRSIKNLTSLKLYQCTFDAINNLTLSYDVYHTTFHGLIGNITRLLTGYEWDLLSSPTKRIDAYPNIYVVQLSDIVMKKGMIIMWYGEEPIPEGWAVCDGTNGTPDLRGRFIKGIDPETEEVGYVDPEGVKEDNTIALTKGNLPKHSHPHEPHYHYLDDVGVEIHNSEELILSSGYSDYVTESSLKTDAIDVVIPSITGDNIAGLATAKALSSANLTNHYGTVEVTGGVHSHDVTVTLGWVYGATSYETEEYELKGTAFKVEPRHYKLIFIMKINTT